MPSLASDNQQEARAQYCLCLLVVDQGQDLELVRIRKREYLLHGSVHLHAGLLSVRAKVGLGNYGFAKLPVAVKNSSLDSFLQLESNPPDIHSFPGLMNLKDDLLPSLAVQT